MKRAFRTWCAAVSGLVFSAEEGKSWREPRVASAGPHRRQAESRIRGLLRKNILRKKTLASRNLLFLP